MKKIESSIVKGIFFDNKKAKKAFDEYVSSDDFLQDAISKNSDYILDSISANIGCMLNEKVVNGKVVCKISYQEIVEFMFGEDFWIDCLDVIENKIGYSFNDDDFNDDCCSDNFSDYMLNKHRFNLIEYCKDIIKIETI